MKLIQFFSLSYTFFSFIFSLPFYIPSHSPFRSFQHFFFIFPRWAFAFSSHFLKYTSSFLRNEQRDELMSGMLMGKMLVYHRTQSLCENEITPTTLADSTVECENGKEMNDFFGTIIMRKGKQEKQKRKKILMNYFS